MKEHFPKLVKELDVQVEESQRVPNKMNPKGPTPRNVIIKIQKTEDKENLRSSREKQLVTYKGAPIRLSDDFSTDTLRGRRDWHKIFQIIESKDLQP